MRLGEKVIELKLTLCNSDWLVLIYNVNEWKRDEIYTGNKDDAIYACAENVGGWVRVNSNGWKFFISLTKTTDIGIYL